MYLSSQWERTWALERFGKGLGVGGGGWRVGTLGWRGVGLPVTLKAAVSVFLFFPSSFFVLLRSLLFRLASPLGPMKTSLKEEERGKWRVREGESGEGGGQLFKSKTAQRGSAVL